MRKQDWDPLDPDVPGRKRFGQPNFEFIKNLGDVNPFDYGGYFIYRDTTGQYEEEAELLVVDEDPRGRDVYTIYRIMLERMKLVDGYLVPFRYNSSWRHPVKQYDAWFHESLGGIAEISPEYGLTKEDLESAFTSIDPITRAEAYRMVADYHGWENFDSDPLTNRSRADVEKRYPWVTRGRST